MASLSISAYAADVGNTARDMELIHNAGADSVHIDVMDGHFVTLTGLGAAWLDTMRHTIRLPLDVHFMTFSPQLFVERFAKYDMSTATIHVEAMQRGEFQAAVRLISRHGIRAGLAISPDTDIESLRPFLDALDEILVMTAQPGEPGAAFLPDSLRRIRAAQGMIEAGGRKIRVSVDGGLDAALAEKCIDHGADNIVMGRAFFTDADPKSLVQKIHQRDRRARNVETLP